MRTPSGVIQNLPHYCAFPQGKCLCGSMTGKLAGPSGTLTCCKAYFLDCELDRTGRPAVFVNGSWCEVSPTAAASSFAYGDSMVAQVHFNKQWKTYHALWMYSQISFLFPRLVGKTKIVFLLLVKL